MSSLPATAEEYLDKELDWDQGDVDRDLSEIATSMIEWEERLAPLLDLTDVEIHDVKKDRSEPLIRY